MFDQENQTCTKSWLPFCVAFAALPPRLPQGQLAILRHRKTPPLCGESYDFYKISCMNPCFPPPRNGGQKATRNGGPQFGAFLGGISAPKRNIKAPPPRPTNSLKTPTRLLRFSVKKSFPPFPAPRTPPSPPPSNRKYPKRSPSF